MTKTRMEQRHHDYVDINGKALEVDDIVRIYPESDATESPIRVGIFRTRTYSRSTIIVEFIDDIYDDTTQPKNTVMIEPTIYRSKLVLTNLVEKITDEEEIIEIKLTHNFVIDLI